MKKWITIIVLWILVIVSIGACSDSDHKVYHKHLTVDRHQSEIDAMARCKNTGGMVALYPIIYSFKDCKYPPVATP